MKVAVQVRRTSWGERTITVDVPDKVGKSGKNRQEHMDAIEFAARKLALDQAGDFEFSNHDYEYEVIAVEMP